MTIDSLDGHIKEVKCHMEQIIDRMQVQESEDNRAPEARPTNVGDPPGFDAHRIHTPIPKPTATSPSPEAEDPWYPWKNGTKSTQRLPHQGPDLQGFRIVAAIL